MTTPLSYWQEPDPESIISRGAVAATTDHVFVSINSTEKFALATAGGEADGVTVAAVTAANDKLSAYTRGAVLVKNGGTTTAGGYVSSDAAGKCVDATPGARVLGYAETGSTVADDLVRVRLLPRPHAPLNGAIVTVTADGAIAIPPDAITTYNITKGGAAAMTIVDPAAGDDGKVLRFVSSTAQAHTLSNGAGSGFNAGGAGSDVGTFAAAIGNGITIQAFGTKWLVIANTNVTLA